jgi:inactive STAND/Effector-associated domain 9
MQELSQSFQTRKGILSRRLASLSGEIMILENQRETSLDEGTRSRLGKKIDCLLDEMDATESKLRKLESSESNFNRQCLSLAEDLSKIDFKEVMNIVDNIRQQIDQQGGTALFLVENSNSMAGTYCVDRIRESLGTVTKKCPIESSPDTGIDERALLARLASHFNVAAIPDNQQCAQAIVKEICESSRGGRTVFIDLRKWGRLLCQEQGLSWFLDHFWIPLGQGLQTVSQKYRGVKVVAVIVVNGTLPSQCSKLPHYCTHDNFDGRKIVKLPLKKWKLKEIRDWLEHYPGLPIDESKTRAKEIYNNSMKGIPQLVVTALENETFT